MSGRRLSSVWSERAARCLGKALLACAVLGVASACAGHAARTQLARTALDANQPKEALQLLNEQLEVKSEEDLPKDTGGDNSLLLLDRSVVLQQLGKHQLSSRDLEVADKQVEMLDFSRGTADEIGKYLFSDDTGPYKSPPYEKLMINTINMINYLARGDLNGGRIEARRFAVMQKYLKENEAAGAELLGAGSYLAGFIFEKSREAQSALRYYDEALQYGEFDTLDEPIASLASRASYRTPRLEKAIERGKKAMGADREVTGNQPAAQGDTAQADVAGGNEKDDSAEVLVIINFGRVPAKIAKRVPIGLALTYASGALSPTDRAQANRLAAQGLVTWVNFPTLGKPRGRYASAAFELENQTQPLDVVAVDKLVIKAWEASKGTVVASAITRMIARVIAGEAANRAGGKGAAGLLLSLATQATLTAADTPDTRSWSTLPARIAVGRVKVPPGTHVVELAASGTRIKKTLVLKPGGWQALNLTVLH